MVVVEKVLNVSESVKRRDLTVTWLRDLLKTRCVEEAHLTGAPGRSKNSQPRHHDPKTKKKTTRSDEWEKQKRRSFISRFIFALSSGVEASRVREGWRQSGRARESARGREREREERERERVCERETDRQCVCARARAPAVKEGAVSDATISKQVSGRSRVCLEWVGARPFSVTRPLTAACTTRRVRKPAFTTHVTKVSVTFIMVQ